MTEEQRPMLSFGERPTRELKRDRVKSQRGSGWRRRTQEGLHHGSKGKKVPWKNESPIVKKEQKGQGE